MQDNGKVFQSDLYFLVNEDEQQSKHLILENIPFGNFTSLSFILGVDSLHNCSGAQSGALDPVNAMFWAWNSGYIFLKLEGSSPVSPLPAHILEYHIGGYKNANNCIRKIYLPLKDLKFTEKDSRQSLYLEADVLKVLMSNTPVDFEKLPSVTDFHNAPGIADNYKEMFKLLTSKHEN
ncbi:hypothetical protein CNR22_20465 [Sphingobacteriaceae bacterium]|nr:hypothetical protein CNR22_20465 [Sphingobacteriaceae bacterium]